MTKKITEQSLAENPEFQELYAEEGLPTDSFQTEMENLNNMGFPDPDDENIKDYQTEIKPSEIMSEKTPVATELLHQTNNGYQTETENYHDADTNNIENGMKKYQSDDNSQIASSTNRTELFKVKREIVIPIGNTRSVETETDKIKNDILDLFESLKSKKILAGTIQGVERSADNPNNSFAVIYHGEIKVIIPAEEAVEMPADLRGQSQGDVLHYLLTKRLGAEVDYIVKGIDSQTGIAAASRLQAMVAKRKQYYWGTDRDGNYLLYSGVTAEGRIVSVIRAGIFVDLFGIEVYIPLKELSYQRRMDATNYYQPGQKILVKILSIDRTDKNNIKVMASVKQAGKNPYEKAIGRFTIGSRYIGTVSMVDINGVFVSLDGGIDCLCQHPKRGRPPRGSRVTVRILGIDNESNRIWGAITHMPGLR